MSQKSTYSQKKEAPTVDLVPESPSNKLFMQLKKFKELLDNGTIDQGEFDTMQQGAIMVMEHNVKKMTENTQQQESKVVVSEKTHSRAVVNVAVKHNRPVNHHVGKSKSHEMIRNLVSKLILIGKPEQAGKTYEVLCRMVAQYKKSNTISIVFCDNSLLQTRQTKIRAAQHNGLGKVCEISSDPSADAKTGAELLDIFYENDAMFSTIVCCAHSKQLHENIDHFLDKMSTRCPQYNFEIYIDEASKVATSKKMVDRVRRWQELGNIGNIYFIDATPEDDQGGLFTEYNEIFLAPSYADGLPISENYVGIEDFNHIEFEPELGEDNVGYAKRILDADPLKSSDYAFIPAGHKQSSHDEMCEMLIAKNAVVVILNGSFKGVRYSIEGLDEVTRFCTMEFPDEKKAEKKQTINDIICTHALPIAQQYGKPLVITGGVVPGRGLSLQKPGLIFTRGIFGPCVANHNMERSQKYGRLKGNIRGWVGYDTVKVHSSKKFHTGCLIQEHTSRWILEKAQLGVEGSETHMDKVTIQEEIRRKTCEYIPEKEEREPEIKKFEGLEGQAEGIAWWKKTFKATFGGNGPNRTSPVAMGPKAGFYIRPLGAANDSKRTEILSTERLHKHRRWNLDRNSDKGRTWYTWWPCYEDVNNKETLQWWLIYYPPNPVASTTKFDV